MNTEWNIDLISYETQINALLKLEMAPSKRLYWILRRNREAMTMYVNYAIANRRLDRVFLYMKYDNQTTVGCR